MSAGKLVIDGPVVHAVSFGKLQFIPYARLTVDFSTGRIINLDEIALDTEFVPESETQYIRLTTGQFLCPGFIDTHYHAPQTGNAGLGLDYALLEWLEKVTFPRECSYSTRSRDSILNEYSQMAKRLLRNGTTTCVYFGSLQLEANKVLVDAVSASGQRALIGKVCMDMNSPQNYCESKEENLEGTVAFINYIKSLKNDKILSVITPRFAPTCSSELMAGLGEIAAAQDCHIQTHISENKNEVAWVRELFPQNSSYAEVYDSAKLLTSKTILAHAIYLEESEKALIKERCCSISHCPNSNFAINSGCLDVRDLLERGVKVSLGTDVSGGYSTSMLDACRQAIIASKVISFSKDSKPLTAAESFSLATLGGAAALEMSGDLGNLLPGKLFDALVVNVAANPQIPLDPSIPLPLESAFEKFLFCGDDRCIEKVFVHGKQVL